MKTLVRFSCLVSLALSVVGCSTKPTDDPSTTKVLMIGNSFSICVLRHLPAVAKDRGVDLDLASLYIGGCSLKRHWENAKRDGDKACRPYRYDRIVKGKRLIDGRQANVCDVLRESKWNIVTIQQASHESWNPESYHPYGDDLVAKIRELAPQAEIYVQETWSYTPWDARLKKWGIDQDVMYEKLHRAYGDFAEKHDLKVIPFGTAVQAWRKRLPVKYSENSLGGDVVGGGKQEERDQFKRNAENKWTPNCDVFHLGRKGDYFQALIWAVRLFDVDLTDIDYRPEYVTEAEAKLMCEIAMED